MTDRTAILTRAYRRASDLPGCPLTLATATQFRRADTAPNTLAVMRFSEQDQADDDIGLVPIRTTGTSGSPAFEIWTSERDVTIGAAESLRYSHDGLLLFAWLHLSEPNIQDVEETVCRAHTAVLRLLHCLDFPHWLRVWTFLSEINAGLGDRERYRRFYVGRHRALVLVPHFERSLPAATAIGTRRNSGLTLAVLASRIPSTAVENPPQINAYDYSRFYGPRSPSSSRGVIQHWEDRSLRYISGTASIFGARQSTSRQRGRAIQRSPAQYRRASR